MGLRQIASIFSGAIGFVASMLYILEKFGVPIVLPPVPSSGPMFDILLLLAIVGAVGFPIWIGYQIRGWRSKKAEKVRPVSFEARIIEKRSYRLGETICFEARFAGTLDKGAFLAEVFHHSGITLPSEEGQVKSVWWSCEKTYGNPTGSGREGNLSGDGPWKEGWCKTIPADFPIGRYDVVFFVREGKLIGGKDVARDEDFFDAVEV